MKLLPVVKKYSVKYWERIFKDKIRKFKDRHNILKFKCKNFDDIMQIKDVYMTECLTVKQIRGGV